MYSQLLLNKCFSIPPINLEQTESILYIALKKKKILFAFKKKKLYQITTINRMGKLISIINVCCSYENTKQCEFQGVSIKKKMVVVVNFILSI